MMGKRFWSARIKSSSSTWVCVSLSHNIWLVSCGHSSVTVALRGSVFSSPHQIDQRSNGNPCAVYSYHNFSCLDWIWLLLPSHGWASPLRSPFTSMMILGTHAKLSSSIINCTVFVFQVQVAPLTRPCLFIIDSGKRTAHCLWTVSSCSTHPIRNAGVSNVYASKSSCRDCVNEDMTSIC